MEDHALLENLQRRVVRTRRLCFVVWFGLLCCTLPMFAGIFISGNLVWSVGAVFFIVLLALFYPVAGHFFRSALKKDIVAYLCKVTDFDFSSAGYFKFSSIRPFRIPQNMVTKTIFPKSEDAFRGKFNGVEFVMQEVVFAGKKYADRPANNHARDIFLDRWVFVLLKTHRKFDGQTIIVPDSMVTKFLHEKFGFMKTVGLVSSEFESKYDVLSTDQVSARYLMDPVMIEKFIEFGKINNTENIEIGFRGERVLLACRSPIPLIWVPDFSMLLLDDSAFEEILLGLRKFKSEIEKLEEIIEMLELI